MKEKCMETIYRKRGRQKILAVAGLCFAFLLLFTSGLSADAKARHERVTLNLKNVSIKFLFDEIQKQTNLFFVFSAEQTRSVGRLSIQATDEELGSVLGRILEGTGLQYKFENDLIIVRKQSAQQKELQITGRVVDEQGQPLLGVTVRLKGMSLGSATDRNGYYILNVPEAREVILLFSFVGMIEQEVKYTGNTTINVVMKEDEQELKEVIVTGYANVRKSSFTGSVTQVSREEILKVGNNNLVDLLQVFDPSLRVIKNNEMGSDPNTLPEFYIRGRSGIDGVKELDRVLSDDISQFALTNNPNLPVFILDGFEVSAEKIYDFDLSRIKAITILKDAAATAIYGSRASNGVLVIETIPPRMGDLKVYYAGNYAITAPDLTSYNLMNAEEKLEAEVAAGLFEPWRVSSSGAQTAEAERRDLYSYYLRKRNNILIGVDNYWLSQPLTTLFNHQHSVRAEGGSEHMRFALEVNYNNQNGVMKESYRDRLGGGMEVDYRYKGLQIRNRITYDVLNAKDSPYGTFSDYTNKHPYDQWEDEDGNLVKMLPQWGNGLAVPENPLYEASLGNFSKNGYTELSDNLSLNWYLNNYLFIKGQVAMSYKDAWGKVFTDPASSVYSRGDLFLKGSLLETGTETIRWNANLFGAYNQQVESHNINVSAGFNVVSTDYRYMNSYYRGFPDAERHSPAYAYEIVTKPTFSDNKTRLFGTFFTLNYSYRDIYLLDGSLRFDGSSEFGSDQKWAPFWSSGTGINIHNYPRVKQIEWINLLRVTGNVGLTGKTNFQPYMARNTFNVLLDDWYPTGIGAKLMYLGNKSLTWERQFTWNLRSEIRMLDNRFHLKWDVYNKKTTDLITEVALPTSSGFMNYTDNVGEILNRGFEIDLTTRVYHSGQWDINLFGNIAHNKNEILKISESLKRYNERVDEYFDEYGMDRNVSLLSLFSTSESNTEYSKSYMKYEEGGSLTAIYGMKSLGINPANGKEVFLKRDGTITYDWSSAEQQKIGDTEPWGQGAFGLNARYGNFTLYTTFLFEFGGDLYNKTLVTNVENANLQYYNVDRRVLTDRWQEVGDVTPLKAIQDRYYVTRPTSRFVQKNNNLTFNSLSLAYDVDRGVLQKIHLSMLRVQFNMKDIATISTIKREMGLSYPFARTFTFSLNASF
ncbi:MAG: SusC/RagA family TonB-linked outer membrane protein [Odoribacteraceae bacterium]|jgi:TonB-linked SusC/RagA family outer membrane protein|nr:SusC/RagA family TonB-linked outer membrane protein [Odoribacteraceae bacterium]